MNQHTIVAAAFVAGCAGFAAIALIAPIVLARYRQSFSAGVASDLGRAFVFVQTGRLMAANLVLVSIAVGLAAWLTRGVLPIVIVALMMAAVPRAVLRIIRTRRRTRFRQQVPELLDLIAGGLRAGHGLSVVMSELAAQMPPPASQELALMQRQQRMGMRFDEALSGLERRMHLEETVLLATALRLGAAAGGDMAGTLDALADAVRRKLALEGKVRALTAQGRLQAWVMGLLPVAMLLALASVEPDMYRDLVSTPGGWAVCGFVLGSETIGIVLIRRIVAIDI